MVSIGDTLYRFDKNHRVYRRDASGRAVGGPIFTEYFVPHQIVGETKLSWLVGNDGRYKVNKKTLREAGRSGFHGYQWHTEDGKQDAIWRASHRLGIKTMLDNATTEQLRKVASIIGYVEHQ